MTMTHRGVLIKGPYILPLVAVPRLTLPDSQQRRSVRSEQHMIKVQSLRNRIILQFLIIIAPLACVPVIVTLSDVQRASDLENSLRLRQLSLEAKDAYARFVEGVVDALDTGTLSNARVAALDAVTAALHEQRRIDPQHRLDRTSELVSRISDTVRTDPSSNSIL